MLLELLSANHILVKQVPVAFLWFSKLLRYIIFNNQILETTDVRDVMLIDLIMFILLSSFILD